MRTAAGGTTTLTINAIWRIVADFDPTLGGPTNALSHLGTEPDVFAVIKQSDVTLQQLKATIWIALGTGATGAQPATKYTITDIEVGGMLPGGNRYFLRCTRQH